MDFTQNEADSELASLSRKIVTDQLTPDRLRAAEKDGIDRALWADLAAAGVLSAALPESLGGSGLGLLAHCAVLAELGREVAPVPYLPSIVLGAGALARFGTPDQQRRWAGPAAPRTPWSSRRTAAIPQPPAPRGPTAYWGRRHPPRPAPP